VLSTVRNAATTIATHAADIAAIATAAGVTATDRAGLVTALQAQHKDVVLVGTLSTEVTSLQSQLNTLTNERAREKATAFLDAQVAAGKAINATLREHYITRHMANPADVETELGAMVSLNAGGLGDRAVLDVALQAEDGLNASERMVCQKMGFDPKKFAEAKKDPVAAAKAKKGAA